MTSSGSLTNSYSQRSLLPPGLGFFRKLEFPNKLGLFDRVWGRSLAARGCCWMPTAAGPVWKLDLTNPTHRWLVYGYYEGPGFWRWLKRHRGSIRTIVDSGANIGQTVIHFSSLVPEARVFAYEPGSEARQWLSDCIEKNHLQKITVSASGLGRAPGQFFLSSEGAANLHGSWNKVNATQGERIEVATLDSEIAKFGTQRIDLWKLDMEGGELDALEGARNLLRNKCIGAVLMETSIEQGTTCTDFLSGFGYSIHRLSPSGRLTPWKISDAYENVLCVAPS